MRSSTYGRTRITTPIATIAQTASMPKSRQGAPATKYITAPVAIRSSVVEVFGCARRRALGMARRARKGNRPFFTFPNCLACGEECQHPEPEPERGLDNDVARNGIMLAREEPERG